MLELSKFLPKSNYIPQMNGLTDETDIANHFVEYSERVCCPFNEVRNSDLIKQYLTTKSNYSGSFLTKSHMFDVDLLSTLMLKMKTAQRLD